MIELAGTYYAFEDDLKENSRLDTMKEVSIQQFIDTLYKTHHVRGVSFWNQNQLKWCQDYQVAECLMVLLFNHMKYMWNTDFEKFPLHLGGRFML